MNDDITEARVSEFPDCDPCAMWHGRKSEAHYDGEVKGQDGRWGFMCDPCWDEHGTGLLGTGLGQRLVRSEE